MSGTVQGVEKSPLPSAVTYWRSPPKKISIVSFGCQPDPERVTVALLGADGGVADDSEHDQGDGSPDQNPALPTHHGPLSSLVYRTWVVRPGDPVSHLPMPADAPLACADLSRSRGANVIKGFKEGGMTMVIATREMGFARAVTDAVCYLDDGVILEQAAPKDPLSNPRPPRTQRFPQRIVGAGRL